VDVNSLANALANAEIDPQKSAIQTKINKSNASISGYSAINFVLSNLQTAFGDLKDQSDFSSITANNSQPQAFAVTTAATASTGSHSIAVQSVATSQRTLSAGFADKTTPLNGGTGFSFSITIGTKTTSVNVPDKYSAPQDVVTANTGVKAQLVNVGGTTPWHIMLEGPTGAANSFTVTQFSPALTGDLMGFNALNPPASDAQLTVDGMPITSATNSVQDAIPGVTLDLYSPTTGNAMLNLDRDTSGVAGKVQALVTSYNDAISMLGVVSDPKSTVDTYGATLVGNSIVSTVRNQIRNLVVGPSDSPSGSITALRDIGVTIDQTGKLQIDSAKLNTTLQSNFDGVVKMLSNNQQDQTKFNPAPAGVAGEAYKKLATLIDPTSGTLKNLNDDQTQKISDYQKQLSALNDRLQVILQRYVSQLSAMDSLVGQIKSTQAGLKSTFDGMMSVYTKN
jgi:flagellar hook-associated protein 2